MFAISVGKDLKLRLFGGGKLLLEHWSNKWYLGAGTKLLIQRLAESVAKLDDTETVHVSSSMKDFANLIQSISETSGAGALFVITPSKKLINKLYHISQPPDELWQRKSFESLLTEDDSTLYKLATMDGATVIDLSVSRSSDFAHKWRAAKVLPRRLIAERFDLDQFKRLTEEEGILVPWAETLSYGSKRASALALAMQARIRKERCVCVVVSSDGPIYFMSSVGRQILLRIPE